MDSSRILRIVVLVVAVLVQLAAHYDPARPGAHEPLPEDAPVLIANRAFAPEDRGLGEMVFEAAFDPASAWDPGGEVVGRTRFRPVSTALFALERGLGRDGTLALTRLVSIALHVFVALGVVGLLRDLRCSRRAAWLAGLVAATSPALLVASAWPARQAVVLATALGVGGVRLVQRDASAQRVAGGLLLAAACLAHEGAVGLAGAALVLVVLRRDPDAPSPRMSIPAIVVPVTLAFVARGAVLAGLDLPPRETLSPGLFDGFAGVVTTLSAPLLPTRLHLVGEQWLAAGWARVACPVLLAAAVALVVRLRSRPSAALWGAAIAAACPVLAAPWVGGATFHHAYAYVCLPLLAAAIGVSLASAAGRGGGLRIAASVSGALLLGASVAGTITAAPALRSRATFLDLAARASPRSAVIAAWRLGQLAQTVPETGPLRGERLLAALPRAHELASRVVQISGDATPYARTLRRDGAAAMGVAASLAAYASAVAETSAEDLPADAGLLLPDLERVAAAAPAVAPDWGGGWLVLVRTCALVGAFDEGLAAAERAAALAPDAPESHELVARMALSVGRTEVALREVEVSAALEHAAAERDGRDVRRDHRMVRAEALAAHAATSGLLVEFNWAVQELLPLYEAGDRERDLRSLLYDIHLLWGDGLASLDRTAPARVAYERAVQLGGEGSEAAEHLRWLESRLSAELRDAQLALDRAASGVGNVANALLELAIVQCRVGDWETADEIFAKIEEGQGGMNAALRFTRAIHRYASRDDQLGKAITELRLVLDEDPAFHEARFRLAGVLLEAGRVQEAAEEYRRAARDGAAYEWAIEALELAHRLEAVLARPSR